MGALFGPPTNSATKNQQHREDRAGWEALNQGQNERRHRPDQ
jgi:hypothetical protein